MKIRFWGTRGSLAKAGPETVRYGGNTSCVEVRSDGGTLIVIDCGTGAHGLGEHLVASGDRPARGHLMISHTHWDHIQGFPFFAPLFVPGNEWDIYAPHGLRQSLRETLAGQMQYTYFPITLEALGATVRYHDLVEGEFHAGDVRVRARYLNHPALTLGYRLEADGVAIVYACDHEPESRQPGNGTALIGEEDQRHVAFLRDADLVIHDAQYLAHEYADKFGWGHSTVEFAQAACEAAGVRRLALTHHDPLRNDAAIDNIVTAADATGKQTGSSMQVLAAAEGLLLELRADDAAGNRQETVEFDAMTTMPAELAAQKVLLGPIDAATYPTIRAAIDDEGVDVQSVSNVAEIEHLPTQPRPALLIVDATRADAETVAICAQIREKGRQQPPQIPIAVVASRSFDGADLSAYATDWLLLPFSREYIRTRVRTWLLRTASRWIRAQEPTDEDERIAALHALGILDSPPEQRFDLLTRIAADTFQVPIVLVSLVDRERQWFKSCIGMDERETHRDVSFCAHAILQEQILIVPDTLLDDRFAENPLVVGPPRVRFYAGCALRVASGHRIGTLCLIDVRPRQLNETQAGLLRNLARLVERELGAPS